MIDLNSIQKNIAKPARIIIYGSEGIGKTTFCTCAPSPIFVQTEGGLVNETIPAFPIAASFEDVLEALEALGNNAHEYKTVVIESLDWLEPLIWAATCKRLVVPSIESPGYGKGYVEADTEWHRFFSYVSAVRDMGMTVIMTAHSAVVRVEDPIHPAYDTHTLKLHKRASAMAKEFSDIIGFCSLKTLLKTEDEAFGSKRNRAISTGERIIHLSGSPAYSAKNRYGMPDTLPLVWNELETYLPKIKGE